MNQVGKVHQFSAKARTKTVFVMEKLIAFWLFPTGIEIAIYLGQA